MEKNTQRKKLDFGTFFKSFLGLFVLLSFAQVSFADLQLNYIHFDPAIISAGDEVDIVIQYEAQNAPFDSSKIGDDEYSFNVKLEADDDLTEKYILITDSRGDDVKGTLYSGEKYYKTFKVKVLNNAPAANYEFKLVGQWYKNGNALDYTEELTFEMPVKKEGIILDISSITTNPNQVRPGDKFVELYTSLENVGEKTAKNIKVKLSAQEGIDPSYSDNNELSVGKLASQESKDIDFTINLDDELKAGEYTLTYTLEYMDLDDNSYTLEKNISLLVKEKPNLVIEKVEGEGLAGSSSTLKVWVKNVGEESAESVDVRVLKQSSQPFEFDFRSSFIGELEPGETGLAVFDIDVLDSADIKAHDLKLVLRAKGDTDEGDDNIYTFNRRAYFTVTGVKQNSYVYVGLGLFALLVIGFLVKGRKKKHEGKK
ncbi:LPXTG cell wall anchor domain-containing protein [Candidatus Woesearchaeota archaeon]|nr:COG1361 S-layer family protein [Nanoarchaeota archaeon]MCB9370761.1 LPXTG cell wall anchor domain-containing protein [Candidatus Woesearchaeota archaeon]USN43837.1 MAG: LPXTG cell wall anchor domain-containing protein [Candidatus Woesearchaeota archaeon]